jgi:hypothetical protein
MRVKVLEVRTPDGWSKHTNPETWNVNETGRLRVEDGETTTIYAAGGWTRLVEKPQEHGPR